MCAPSRARAKALGGLLKSRPATLRFGRLLALGEKVCDFMNRDLKVIVLSELYFSRPDEMAETSFSLSPAAHRRVLDGVAEGPKGLQSL